MPYDFASRRLSLSVSDEIPISITVLDVIRRMIKFVSFTLPFFIGCPAAGRKSTGQDDDISSYCTSSREDQDDLFGKNHIDRSRAVMQGRRTRLQKKLKRKKLTPISSEKHPDKNQED